MKEEFTPLNKTLFYIHCVLLFKHVTQNDLFLWELSETNSFIFSSSAALSLSQSQAFLTKQTYYFCMLQLLVD